jgi:hypothetical protein
MIKRCLKKQKGEENSPPSPRSMSLPVFMKVIILIKENNSNVQLPQTKKPGTNIA